MTLELRGQAAPETLVAVDTLADAENRKAQAIRAFPPGWQRSRRRAKSAERLQKVATPFPKKSEPLIA